MPSDSDIRPVGAELYFLPVHTRVPLKFGGETVEYVTCARCRLIVEGRDGRRAEGWGETPLSVTWVWPSTLPYEERHQVLRQFCRDLAEAWAQFDVWGHPLEIGHRFIEDILPGMQKAPMPWLAALVCDSLFDIALHDAYGQLHACDVYSTYNDRWMNQSLEAFLEPAMGSEVDFSGRYPSDFFEGGSAKAIDAWHLVGGVDPVLESELTGSEPDDDYPVLLADWIETDGLRCLKIKLRGNDADWDYQRIVQVGELASAKGCHWLTTDFNCMVTEPDYVNGLLDKLRDEHPALYGMLLYVEQPFPYELSEHPIDVHSVSARKPLFLDESAHDWREVRRGRELGWSGVALKTCKTQTGALLSACWARAHGMTLMVQDLTNPMLAQIPHVRLAAKLGTIMGVETNAMQFYPAASAVEAQVHPDLYVRRDGQIGLSSLSGPGFGYRISEIERELPPPEVRYGAF